MLPTHIRADAARESSAADHRLERTTALMAIALIFLGVHAFLFVIVLGPEQAGATDVNLYEYWMDQARNNGLWPVVDFEWVYPGIALVPMLAASWLGRLLGGSYMVSWLLVVSILDALACVVLWRTQGWPRATRGIVAWLAFLALLGPTALTRVDSIVAPMILIGLAVAAAQPRLATILLTLGAWIKVAPGAVVLPLLAKVRRPVLDVIVPGAVTCAVVISGMMALGAPPSRILAFFTTQAGRGLQAESVGATPFVVSRAMSGGYETIVDYNDELGTYEVGGPTAHSVGLALDVVLFLAAAAIVVLAWRARHEGDEVLLLAALAALTAMIVTNKVGSPQFLAWIGPPIALAIAFHADSRWWRWMAGLVGFLALLTHLLYPTLYFDFIFGRLIGVALVVVRNAGLVTLLALAVAKLWKLGRGAPLARWPLGRS